MAKRKNVSRLKVYLNDLPLGEIGYDSKKSLTFTYLQEWLSRSTAFPISRCLPLREDPYEGEAVFSYFDNMLPDGISIRQRIAARMGARSDQVFDLLSVLGRDCVGALQFINENEEDELPEESRSLSTPISDDEIAEKIRNLGFAPLGASREEDFRISIAGAQEKTAFLWQDGRWNIPHGSMPTTHIFKPQIGKIHSGPDFSDSVENEWLCAQITEAFGLPTTNCEIKMFDDIKVLVVERFDRVWLQDRLIRIPQEDMCQALAVPNYKKYESEGGSGISAIMSVLSESKEPAKDRRLFMKAQIVFFLLAAIDGHAKNFSLRWGPLGFELTKLYDILSAQPIVDRGDFQIQKLKMSMAVGENRHWKVVEIMRRHFEQTARLCKFDLTEMSQILDEIVTETPLVIERVKNRLPKTFPAEVATSIFDGMMSRLPKLSLKG